LPKLVRAPPLDANALLAAPLQLGRVLRRLQAGQQFGVAGIEGSGFLSACRSVGSPKLGPLLGKRAASALFIAHARVERIWRVGCGGATRRRHVKRRHVIRDGNDELRTEQSGKERMKHDDLHYFPVMQINGWVLGYLAVA